MKLRDGYIRAAERIFEGINIFSCVAVKYAFRPNAMGSDSDIELERLPEVKLYRNVFQDNEPIAGPIWKSPDRFADQIYQAEVEEGIDGQELRMNLLCMMAACCEDFRDQP